MSPVVVYSFEHSYSQDNPDELAVPEIPVTLIYGGFDVTVPASMDSGASISVFPDRVAASLRINLDEYSWMEFDMLKTGTGLRTRLVDLTLVIKGIRLDSTVGFSSDVAESVLGRHRVFDQLRVGFDHAVERLLLTEVL